jgi:hypothetical protein
MKNRESKIAFFSNICLVRLRSIRFAELSQPG